MNIKINDLNINYEIFGSENKRDVLLLHGWGANILTFAPVYKYLSKNFKVYVLDFPGFGKSEEPKRDFNVSDYAKLTLEFIEKLNIKSPTLIGHSFGGRVIIKMVGEYRYIPKNIVFVDSAGIKAKRSISYYFKVYSYKLTKNIIKVVMPKEKSEILINKLRKNSGSDDYRKASDNMKKTFINVVNEDLTHLLKNIKVPALLIWGENDKDTPIRDAKIFEKLISDSGLVVLKGAGHYSYLDKLNEFLLILSNFLEGDKN